MKTIKTTFNIDSEIMEGIKLLAVNKNKTQNEIVNNYLKQGLINETGISPKETLSERIKRLGLENKVKIANEKKYNPNSMEKELNSIVGLAKAPKGVNPVKALLDLRNCRD